MQSISNNIIGTCFVLVMPLLALTAVADEPRVETVSIVVEEAARCLCGSSTNPVRNPRP